jgi:transposase
LRVATAKHCSSWPSKGAAHATTWATCANPARLTASRTQAVCRLHALLCLLIAGGRPGRLNAQAARAALDGVGELGLVDAERKAVALELVTDVGRLDDQIATIKRRIPAAVAAADTTLTDVCGVGPIVAAIILGHSGDIGRFRSAGHYARYNATAPIEASSGPRGSRLAAAVGVAGRSSDGTVAAPGRGVLRRPRNH